MSCVHRDPIRPIANLIPRKYNYLTSPVFWTVHYYNGNSSRLSPIQIERGTHICIFSPRHRFIARNCLTKSESGETTCICMDQAGQTGKLFYGRPTYFHQNRGYCRLRNARYIAQSTSSQ